MQEGDGDDDGLMNESLSPFEDPRQESIVRIVSRIRSVDLCVVCCDFCSRSRMQQNVRKRVERCISDNNNIFCCCCLLMWLDIIDNLGFLHKVLYSVLRHNR